MRIKIRHNCPICLTLRQEADRAHLMATLNPKHVKAWRDAVDRLAEHLEQHDREERAGTDEEPVQFTDRELAWLRFQRWRVRHQVGANH